LWPKYVRPIIIGNYYDVCHNYKVFIDIYVLLAIEMIVLLSDQIIAFQNNLIVIIGKIHILKVCIRDNFVTSSI